MDYYVNAIPLGLFSFALAFIIYWFYTCKIYTVNGTFLWSVILLFGGIGQCTAGFLEYFKDRGFPSAFYLNYGFFCLSHYTFILFLLDLILIEIFNLYNYSKNSLWYFYSTWVLLSFGLIIDINLLFILQS